MEVEALGQAFQGLQLKSQQVHAQPGLCDVVSVSVHCIIVSEEEKAVEGILQGHSQAGAVAQR